MSNKKIIARIEELIENGYAETHVDYHPDFRFVDGEYRRGCYALIALPYDGTGRTYASSYAELLDNIILQKEDDLYNWKRSVAADEDHEAIEKLEAMLNSAREFAQSL